MSTVTHKTQLKVGDRVQVEFTTWISKHATVGDRSSGQFYVEQNEKCFDNGQIGKPTMVREVREATIVKQFCSDPCMIVDGYNFKDSGRPITSSSLKNFKSDGGSVRAAWGGTPYRGTWYNTSAKIIAIVTT